MALLHRRSTSKRASQKMRENNAAMPDDASANDNVSSARPEPAAFVPTPFDEVIDISDLVAERRRLQRNLWAMRIITIVLLIAAIAVACFPLALQFAPVPSLDLLMICLYKTAGSVLVVHGIGAVANGNTARATLRNVTPHQAFHATCRRGHIGAM